MIASILLAVAVSTSPPPGEASAPTPQQIYAAGRTDFAAMIKSSQLKQEFLEQSDGTFLGVARPTFEQQQSKPFLAKEVFSNVLGTWDAVARRIGSVHDKNGKLVPLEAALEIKESNRTTYLVVTAVDSQSKPGQHVCVETITGVGESLPPGFEKPELRPRRFGALVGCGLIKSVLLVFDEDRVFRAGSLNEALNISNELTEKIAEALGYKLTTIRKEFTGGAEDPVVKTSGGGER